MCEYCKLFSGDRITLAEDDKTEIKIKRHNKEYSCKRVNCDTNSGELDCKDCIKQYFKNKVKEL